MKIYKVIFNLMYEGMGWDGIININYIVYYSIVDKKIKFNSIYFKILK